MFSRRAGHETDFAGSCPLCKSALPMKAPIWNVCARSPMQCSDQVMTRFPAFGCALLTVARTSRPSADEFVDQSWPPGAQDPLEVRREPESWWVPADACNHVDDCEHVDSQGLVNAPEVGWIETAAGRGVPPRQEEVSDALGLPRVLPCHFQQATNGSEFISSRNCLKSLSLGCCKKPLQGGGIGFGHGLGSLSE